jgi:hypothetical protein
MKETPESGDMCEQYDMQFMQGFRATLMTRWNAHQQQNELDEQNIDLVGSSRNHLAREYNDQTWKVSVRKL